MIKLFFAEIGNDLETIKSKNIILYISQHKQRMMKQLTIRNKLVLYSELLLRIVLCKELNISNKEIVLEYNDYGKPFLRNYNNFYFNVSHTENAIVVAISDACIGIDIEKIRTIDLSIAKRFYADFENKYLFRSQENIYERFFEIWTKKEAYIKYIGKGLSISLDSFDTFNTTISKQIRFLKKRDYIISICSDSCAPKYNTVEISEAQIEALALNTFI